MIAHLPTHCLSSEFMQSSLYESQECFISCSRTETFSVMFAWKRKIKKKQMSNVNVRWLWMWCSIIWNRFYNSWAFKFYFLHSQTQSAATEAHLKELKNLTIWSQAWLTQMEFVLMFKMIEINDKKVESSFENNCSILQEKVKNVFIFFQENSRVKIA